MGGLVANRCGVFEEIPVEWGVEGEFVLELREEGGGAGLLVDSKAVVEDLEFDVQSG